MAQPYVGEIRIFAGSFAPAGWELCNGQLLPISENETLFTLIGTTYGGDGQETFGLPNLQSRIPIHQFQGLTTTNRVMGEMGGVEQVTLTTQQIPVHNHPALATNAPGNVQSPTGAMMAVASSSQPGVATFGSDTVSAMRAGSILPAGGSQPHDNMQPFLAVHYIISLFGIYPTQT